MSRPVSRQEVEWEEGVTGACPFRPRAGADPAGSEALLQQYLLFASF